MHDQIQISTAVSDVIAERATHAERGWTPEHDAEHGVRHLLHLAADYADRAAANDPPSRGDAVKAASLLVAAIELIDRQGA